MKNFKIVNNKNNYETKRFFFKLSYFQFRSNPFMQSGQIEQIIAGVCRTVKKKQKEQSYQMIAQEHYNSSSVKMEQQVSQKIDVPKDEEFLKSPRLPFLDALFSNELFTKKFTRRFYTFYQVHNLFLGTVPIQHKQIKQFYQKVRSRCVMDIHRLKKISFNFTIPGNQNAKIRLYLTCVKEQNDNIRQNNYKDAIPFTIDVIADNETSLIQTNLNMTDSFIHHLYESLRFQLNYIKNQMYDQIIDYQDLSFVQFYKNQTLNKKVFRPINQVGFCRILCQFSFFIDRIIFRNHSNISTNTTSSVQSLMLNFNHLKKTEAIYKLPLSQQYRLKKYMLHFCVEVKSNYNYNDYQKLQHPYQDTINKIMMYRKKMAKEFKKNSFYECLEFPVNTNIEFIKGLCVYVDQIFKKWNPSDSYIDINNFVADYLNIIVDQNKDKNQKHYFKPAMSWRQVIDGLSALIESLTRSFSSPDTTILFYILRTYEDNHLESIITYQVSEGDQIMLMTFKLFRISQAGWLQVIPSCQYYFQMKKHYTIVYTNDDKVEKELISMISTKEQIEKTFRSYLQKTLKYKCQLPPTYYDKK